ncbi:ankyrin repeat-containing protein At5g02620 [Rosa chinensis]|nr:ankyrin repeat-containing protein At5g02620 [Rosa chinensis]XP_040375540.1 ankyrin repeat-containing protein At5g02620 [Rosa chinensis]
MRLIKYPSNLIFDAAEIGNYEFLAVLMSSYPELVWETDEKNRTIIHVAVLHRPANIFNLVHEIGSIKDVIVTFEDDQGNNIVHMAAKIAPQNQLNLVSGVALQMQRELVWFEEVKKIVQPQYIEMENKKGKTQELFTKEHQTLMRQGEKWMKDTATSCLLVATIIATVVFSAAFSIPGGTDEHTGKPNFLKEKAFLYFTIADGVALFSSSTAMLMFLFILTSRYAENDFLMSLPLKLMIGLTCLFVSIASIMMAFSTAFYLSCQYGSRWTPDLTFFFAIVPIALYAFMQFPLVSDMSSSTFCSSLLFQPWKHMIY